MDEDSGRITFRDICIAIGYAIAIGINVYLVLDQATNGESSQQMSLWLTRTRGKWRQAISIDEQVQKEKPYVIWEAMQTVEGKQP